MRDLSVLHDERDTILLAEALGWLHDYRKCHDKFIAHGESLSRNELLARFSQVVEIDLDFACLSEAHEDMCTLLNKWKGKAEDTDSSYLLQYISRCHRTAHFDKQEPKEKGTKGGHVTVSSPFGFESDVSKGLTDFLWRLPWHSLAGYSRFERQRLRESIERLFSQTIADTRHPINEVDLWSWGLLVGSLYKSALAGAVLSGEWREAFQLRWRLLEVRAGGLEYLTSIVRIPDLLARRRVFAQGLDRVRELLEVTYPLGSEVYRDENGSICVVPDIHDLLDMTDGSGAPLRELIIGAFDCNAIEADAAVQPGGEIVLDLELEPSAWWGQDPGWPNSSADELPGIGKMLSSVPVLRSSLESLMKAWGERTATEVCTVCGVRPQGPSTRARDSNVCDVCEQRRIGRARQWAVRKRRETIWIDEVADVNGRLALVVGRFELADWLSGNVVASLLVDPGSPTENGKDHRAATKNPSFGRLRRIWEATHGFWREVERDARQELTDYRRRLAVHLAPGIDLAQYYAYELELVDSSLSLLWIPAENDAHARLLTTDNLGYIAHQLGATRDLYRSPASAAIFVEDHLRNTFIDGEQRPTLHKIDSAPGGDSQNILPRHSIIDVQDQETEYATMISLLTQPQLFMALVPADKAMGIVEDIKQKYEREMSKVQDRLPLHLGLVVAQRRTPIRAVLEAGQAMLQVGQATRWEEWSVEHCQERSSDDAPAYLKRDDKHFQKYREVLLKRDGRQMTLRMSTVMGDGETEDLWYPNFLTEKPDGVAEHLIHVRCLEKGQSVWVAPSTFDFEYLDTTGRRFEISYDCHGRRRGHGRRPYLLSEFDDLQRVWKMLCRRLTKSQRMALDGLIEGKRRTWQEPVAGSYSAAFCRFVEDVIHNAQWKTKPDGKDFALLKLAALNGTLHDAMELYHEALKIDAEEA